MVSFVRQLNLYGFKKIRSTVVETYTHQAFKKFKGIRGIKEIEEMRRKRKENVSEDSEASN